MPDTPALRLFVSHVSEDRPAALEVVGELERRGIRCWIAPRDVHPGRPFDDEIVDAIEGSRAMLLIFSDHCNDSDYIRREVTVAGESHKVIIPFRIEDVQPRRGLRVRLSDLHWIDAFAERERALDEVAKQFDDPDGAGEPPRPHPIVTPPLPRRKTTIAVNRSWLLIGGAIVAAVLLGVGLSALFNRSPAPAQQAAVASPPSMPAPPAYRGPEPITVQPMTGGPFQSRTPADPDAVPLARTLTGHQGYVASIAFSPDGKELVSAGGPDMTVKFWDVATGQMIRSVWGSETDHKNLASVAFSPDGRLVAVAGWEGLIKFFNIVSGEVVATLKSGSMITSIAFSPDGRLLVQGNASGTTRVVIWDIARGQVLRGTEGIHGDVNAVVFSPDGRAVAAGISDFTISPNADNSIKLWSAADGRLMQTIADNPGHFQKIAYAPDGKTLASTGFQNSAKIWDIASGRLVRGVADSQNAWGLAYSPDGRMLALGSSEIGLWNAGTGTPIRKLEGPRDTYYCIAFSPDGRLVAAGSQDRAIRLWDVSKVATAAK